MPRDITAEVRDATQRTSTLDGDARYELLLRLRRSGRVDWDKGAAEDWISLLDQQEPLAIVHVRLPFAVVTVARADLAARLRGQGFVTVLVGTMTGDRLSIDPSLAHSAFTTVASTFEPDDFTPHDLWWVTV